MTTEANGLFLDASKRSQPLSYVEGMAEWY